MSSKSRVVGPDKQIFRLLPSRRLRREFFATRSLSLHLAFSAAEASRRTPKNELRSTAMRSSLVLLVTVMTAIASLTAAFTTTEAMNRVVPAATTATPNLRVGMVRIKDGNRTADVVLFPKHCSIRHGDSAATEERAMPFGSWVEALKKFIKNPVLFTKIFILIRKGGPSKLACVVGELRERSLADLWRLN
ncbi:hypothetical protein GQ600_18751 [Phytophthora cactorum]|nr:hypothetical protein GQ600_18751 [Phytophthora cactorum]